MKGNGLLAGIAVFTFGSVCVHATERQVAAAPKHVEMAAKAADGKAIAGHGETATTAAKVGDAPLSASVPKRDGPSVDADQGYADLAKKAGLQAPRQLRISQ